MQAASRDRKVLIVVGDGGDSASAHNLAKVLQIAEQSSALVYTIGDVPASAAQPGAYRSRGVAAGAAGYGMLFVLARVSHITGEPGPDKNEGSE